MIPAVLLMGPTATGKSALALALAERIGGEIVSVDSAQVYRGMDIGTAKPDAATRARIAHHLIDIVDPTESYSAARFSADAQASIAAIRARGHVPIVAGGTMLYFKALTDGLSALPPADPAVRARIDARAVTEVWPSLHAALARVDPARAKRFDAMLAAGLVDELRSLRARFALAPTLPSMRSVGYRQAWDFLDGRIDEATLRAKGVAATRQLAKRQLTWLRSLRVPAFEPEAPGLVDDVLALLSAPAGEGRREPEAIGRGPT
jgi:tRNA dimethylallyltransferase